MSEENWKAYGLGQRGRHATFNSALAAAYQALTVERNAFYEMLVGNWKALFPDLAAKPGRAEGGRIWLYVRSAPASFAIRPKLPAIRRRLAELPGAPKRLEVRLEIHAC